VVFRPMPGFDGYCVGSDGSAWSRRTKAGTIGSGWAQLTPSPQTGGYPRITPCRGGRDYGRYVHILVLEAFFGPCPPGMEACHVGVADRTCNRIANLRWGTRLDNAADRDRHGNTRKGERHHRAKLTVEQVAEIKPKLNRGDTQRRLAREHGMSLSSINFIHIGRNWRDIQPAAI
jgi:hypothetical protein